MLGLLSCCKSRNVTRLHVDAILATMLLCKLPWRSNLFHFISLYELTATLIITSKLSDFTLVNDATFNKCMRSFLGFPVFQKELIACVGV